MCDLIVISLQLMELWCSELGIVPVAIGKPSTPTPVGSYTIERMVVRPNNTMSGVFGSHVIALNNTTVSIHGNNCKDKCIKRRVSNGCIRLRRADIKRLFSLTHFDTQVVITDKLDVWKTLTTEQEIKPNSSTSYQPRNASLLSEPLTGSLEE